MNFDVGNLSEHTEVSIDILIRVDINYMLRFCKCYEEWEEEEDVKMVNFTKENSKTHLNMDNHCCVERKKCRNGKDCGK